MNKIAYLLTCLGLLSLTSCGDCEDKTLQVNAELLNWLPYTTDTIISFSDQNQVINYTVSPNVTNRVEENDDDCMTTSVQPYIILENENQPGFLQVWFVRNENVLGESDELWGILNDDDEIKGSGAIFNITNSNLITSQVTLNDIAFDEIIKLDLNSNGAVAMVVYLQKNVGLVGFEYEGKLWIAE
jgi:hypothetical protein